jgi:hypothetical protein
MTAFVAEPKLLLVEPPKANKTAINTMAMPTMRRAYSAAS